MKFGLRELIFFKLMVGLLLASYFFVFAKATTKKRDLLADIHAKQAELSNLKQATVGIDDLGHKIDELKKAITFFESKLPQEKEVDKILREVWQLAGANQLQTRTVKPAKTERSASYSEQPIEMSLAGDFTGFYSFLLQLEKLPRITRLSRMNLQKISDRDGHMTAQLTLSIFFEPDGAAASAR